MDRILMELKKEEIKISKIRDEKSSEMMFKQWDVLSSIQK